MERLGKSVLLTVVISLMFLGGSAFANPQVNNLQVEPELEQVALFKNGLGFFVSQIECPKQEYSFSFIPAGAASHGTFWVAYPKEVKLQSLITQEVDSEDTTEAITIAELIKANIGRKVKLNFLDTELDCTIKYFADDRQSDEPEPYSPGSFISSPPRSRRTTNSNLLIVEADGREICIELGQIKKAVFPEGKSKKNISTKNKAMRIDVKLAEPAKGGKLSVSYLAKGVTWAPSYFVDITDSSKAQISAKAVVINEVCDFENVTIQLVTGFPNLKFADVVSPLALKENLAQFLQALNRRESRRDNIVMSNVMSQSERYRPRGMPGSGFLPEYGSAQAGMAAEDLFFYPVENVNLAKGQVGYFPLFTEQVPFKHIYKWEIPDYVNEDDYYRRDRQKPIQQEDVWHCIRLENTTKVPWTTAPAEIAKAGFILGQDTLNYTPAKGESTVRITQAINVKAEQLELETNRQRDAAQLYGHHYDLVTVEGKLLVSNFQDKVITLEISKTLSGDVKAAQPEAKIESLAQGLKRMNAVKKLTWTIELEAGKSREIAYTYQVYVRR